MDWLIALALVTRTLAPPDVFTLGSVQVIALPDQTVLPGSLFYGTGGTHLTSIDPPPTGHDGVQNTSVRIHALDPITTGYNDNDAGCTAAPVLTTGYSYTPIRLRA